MTRPSPAAGRLAALLDGPGLLWLVALGIAFRIAAVLAFPVYPLVDNTADTAIYDAGARSLAAGLGYQWGGRPTAFFPVGWPLLLSLAYRTLGETARSGQLLNLIFSIGALGAAWALARRVLGVRGGRLVVLVLALAPHQVVYPAFLMSETSFTAFFIASLALVAGWSAGVPPVAAAMRLAAAGLLMGAATLIRGPALVFPLAVAAWGRFGVRAGVAPSLGGAVLFALALLVPLAPWAARNHRVFDRWVLVANDGGMNFLMGNHHGATGARHEPADGLPDTGDEVADDREGYARGLRFVRERPVEFLSLLPRKFVRLTVPAPLLTYRAELRAKWPPAVALGLLALDQLLHVVLWGSAGLAVLRHRHAPAVLFGLITIGLWTAIHLAFLGGARYFFPVMPLLVLVAAAALVSERES